jgi:hypothetical protein
MTPTFEQAWTLFEAFRAVQFGGEDPLTIDILDCSESGWRCDVQFLHHDGEVTLMHFNGRELAVVLAAAVFYATESLPWALKSKGLALNTSICPRPEDGFGMFPPEQKEDVPA